MSEPTLPNASFSRDHYKSENAAGTAMRLKKMRKTSEKSDVLISAVISPYLLTHLHHVLQKAEYGATCEGRTSQASNFAQLRKVLCMDARSMEDASAKGTTEEIIESSNDEKIERKAA